MKSAIEMVKEFHKKYGFPISVPIKVEDKLEYSYHVIGDILINLAKSIEKKAVNLQDKGDPLLYRVHLMIEELGELIKAISENYDVDIFDGLIDLLYVVIGTGITFGFPLSEGFKEVHISNMTKAPRSEAGTRMRNKGKNFEPPELERLLFDIREFNKGEKNEII